MKNCKLLLVWLIAAAYASPISSDAQTQQAVGANTAESLSGVNSPPPIVPKPVKHGRNPVLRGHFPNTKDGMVKEMRATSTFVQQEAAKRGALDDWLMALAAFGLIVLQLRHKHKSLPQRRITPHG